MTLKPQEHFNTQVARTFLQEATDLITHREVIELSEEEKKNVFIIHTPGAPKEHKVWYRYTEEVYQTSKKMLMNHEIEMFQLRIFKPFDKTK